MSTAPYRGAGCDPAPAPPIILPPGTTAYRRRLFLGRGVSVYYDRHHPNEWPEHTHQQAQGTLVLSDSVSIIRWRTPDGVGHEQRVEGPAVWIVPGGMPHGLSCPSEADMVTLFMEEHFIQETLRQPIREFALMTFAQLGSCDPLAGQVGRAFQTLCRDEEHDRPLYVECIGTTLSAHLLQAMFGLTTAGRRAGGLSAECLGLVMRYIDDHLSEPLRLDRLAKVAGMCRSRFTERFKVSLGLTACAYIIRRRVETAQRLLETSDMKTIDIALTCGFSDETSLARAFRRILHCTPREIRAQRPR